MLYNPTVRNSRQSSCEEISLYKTQPNQLKETKLLVQLYIFLSLHFDSPRKMSDYFIDNYLDDCDKVSMDRDRYIHLGHSGKGRSKKEAREHTNRHDPNGHTRKTTQKLINNNHNSRTRSASS